MNIFCVGRNYVAHAEELGNEIPSSPLIFIKPESSINLENHFTLPDFSNNIHFEGEIVLRIGREGKQIPRDEALNHVSDMTFGFDFTARDIQDKLKSQSHPWELAKAFDQACALGRFIDFDPSFERDLSFQTIRNRAVVQDGNTSLMIYSFSVIIAYLSQFFKLTEGDLIFTGTPAGVGKLEHGDVLSGMIEGQELINLKII